MTIAEQIIANYGKLNETDLSIWEYVTQNKTRVKNMSIDELATETMVSRTTVSRFVRKIGMKGFSEFKFRLSIELEKLTPKILSNVYEDACSAMIQYIEEQRYKDYDKICRLIHKSKNKFVYGTGDIQVAVAKQVKRMFMQAKEVFYDVGGSTFDKAMYEVMDKDDLIIIISLSGNNESALKIARTAKLNNVKIVSITEFKDNELSRLSDASLYISATPLDLLEQRPNYKLTMIYFILVELLFIKYTVYKGNLTNTTVQS